MSEDVRGKDVDLEVHVRRMSLRIKGKPVLEGSLADVVSSRAVGEGHWWGKGQLRRQPSWEKCKNSQQGSQVQEHSHSLKGQKF